MYDMYKLCTLFLCKHVILLIIIKSDILIHIWFDATSFAFPCVLKGVQVKDTGLVLEPRKSTASG